MIQQNVPQSSGTKSRFFYGYVIVVAAFCIMVLIYGAYYAFGVFFKPVLTDFGWTRALTSGAFSLSMIVHGLLAIVMGGLTDRFGPRVVITLCGFLLGLGYLLMSQIGAVWQLYLFYGVIIGAGMSGSWVPILSTVARWFVRRRSMMSGVVLASTGVAALIAPQVANQLITVYGWRQSYIILGIAVLLIVVLSAQFLRRDPTQMRQVPYGASKESEQGFKPRTEDFSLKKAIYIKQFWQIFAMLFCFGFSFILIIVHIVPHAMELGISAASAASILSVVGGLMIVGRLGLGAYADRIGNRQMFIMGFILMSAALFWLVPSREALGLYVSAGLIGFATGGMGASESPLVAKFFGLSSHGLIYGVLTLGFTSGAAVGPLLAGYIFDLTGSYQLAFLIAAVIAVVGLISTVLLKPIRGEGWQNTVIAEY